MKLQEGLFRLVLLEKGVACVAPAYIRFKCPLKKYEPGYQNSFKTIRDGRTGV